MLKMAGKRSPEEDDSLSAADVSVKRGKHVLSEGMLSVDEEESSSQVSCMECVAVRGTPSKSSSTYEATAILFCRPFSLPSGREVSWDCLFTRWSLPPCTSWQTVRSGRTSS